MNRIKKIIVHWSASSLTTNIQTIRSWHKARGWRDIGYHRIILHPDALLADNQPIKVWSDLVKEGRHLDNDPYLDDFERGAHTVNMNKDSVGICVIGNPQHKLHPLQKEALESTIKILVKRFGLSMNDVYGHRDFNNTQCPGDEIYSFIQSLKKVDA